MNIVHLEGVISGLNRAKESYKDSNLYYRYDTIISKYTDKLSSLTQSQTPELLLREMLQVVEWDVICWFPSTSSSLLSKAGKSEDKVGLRVLGSKSLWVNESLGLWVYGSIISLKHSYGEQAHLWSPS